MYFSLSYLPFSNNCLGFKNKSFQLYLNSMNYYPKITELLNIISDLLQLILTTNIHNSNSRLLNTQNKENHPIPGNFTTVVIIGITLWRTPVITVDFGCFFLYGKEDLVFSKNWCSH